MPWWRIAARPAPRAIPERLDLWALKDLQGGSKRPFSPNRSPARQVRRAHQVRRDLPVHQDLPARKASRVLPGLPGFPARLDFLVRPAPLDPLARPVLPGRRALRDRPVPPV